MQSLTKLNRQVRDQQRLVAGCRNDVYDSCNAIGREVHRILSRPASLSVSFALGWWVARIPRRPVKIKQAKNVTIKRPSLVSQLFKSAFPFLISQFVAASPAGHDAHTTGSGPDGAGIPAADLPHQE